MEEQMTERQMLNYAIENGIIDINTLQMQIEMNERKKYLEMHQNKVWQGSNGYYYTKIEDQSKKDGRRTIKKRTAQELEDEIVSHYKNADNEPTIEDVFGQWLEQKRNYGEIQRQTVERYRQDFERFFISSGFSERKMKYLTEIDLEEFVKSSIAQNHLTSKAYGNMRTLMYGMFKYAKKRGLTDVSITSFFGDLDISRKVFSKNYKTDEQCVFSEQEMQKLVQDLSERPTLGNLGILFAAYTGMRVGEIVALKWEDIHDKYIYVHRTQIRYRDASGKYVCETKDSPKTEAGIRNVIIVENLVPVIKKLRRINPFSEYVFQRGDGVITKYVVEMSLYRACDRIGIPRRSMHALRKTYATRLINSHIDDAIIINQMGHTDIRTTRNYYYYNDKSFDLICEMIGKVINY